MKNKSRECAAIRKITEAYMNMHNYTENSQKYIKTYNAYEKYIQENYVIFNIPNSQTSLEKVDSSSGLVKMSAI